MSPLETIMTVVVWSAVAAVFFYYRSLAIKKQQRSQNPETRLE
jgi:hypothetical protein